MEAWRVTQGKFVDDPAGAIGEADALVARVMRDRGYPVDEFEQRAADVSVDHPRVAENYRAAHAVSLVLCSLSPMLEDSSLDVLRTL
jgi:hypothetical protein